MAPTPIKRLALATALFKDGHLPLRRAARLAEMPLAEFIRHLSSEGIPATIGKAREVKDDLETLRKWRRSS
jgi:predicted HTH domain antitoxin